jgi:hypothetical protein
LLEQVHKAQTGFLDTERLLRKVEDEIGKIEERNKRNNQINILYEQAHGLIRSKSWRMVLDKMEEIQKLDHQFVDKDGIFEKAKTELEHEEEAVQRQNELAAMYTEAVRLLKEGKYQEALDKWQEVKAIDTKYPDRQRVQSIAIKNLRETKKPIQNRPRLAVLQWIGIGIIGIIAIASIFLFSKGSENPISSPPFIEPKIDGYRLDWCYTMGENCGEAVAIEWCTRKGYVGVVSFEGDFLGTTTKVISSGEVCSGNCGSFSFITCLKASNRFISLSTSMAPTPLTSHRWDFGDGLKNWGLDSNFYDITVPTVKNGYLTFRSTGQDPQILSPDSLQIAASATPIITIRMRIMQGQSSQGQIYFVTNRDNDWGEAKKVSFFIGKDDGMFKTYDIPMSINPYWKDEITQLRLDPTNIANAQIEIDYISVHAP